MVNDRMTYEAIFDAFRDAAWSANCAVDTVIAALTRPSVLYRPNIAPDGTAWSALYGENIMEGVCGFGDTPEQAMADFDRAWREAKTPTAARLESSK